MILLLIKLLTMLALQATPTAPQEFIDTVMRCDRPVFRPQDFIGCMSVYNGPDTNARGEVYFAGVTFNHGVPELISGP